MSSSSNVLDDDGLRILLRKSSPAEFLVEGWRPARCALQHTFLIAICLLADLHAFQHVW